VPTWRTSTGAVRWCRSSKVVGDVTRQAYGCARLTCQYEMFGRPAYMVMYAHKNDGSAPTFDDCHTLAQVYGLWENNGIGIGYSLLRSADSIFQRCNVTSIDPRGGRSFIDQVFSRSGQLPDFFALPLPTGRAPIVHWHTDELGDRTARNYLVGLTAFPEEPQPDLEELPEDFGLAIATVMSNLTLQIGSGWDGVHCALTSRWPGATKSLLAPLEIRGCGVYNLTGSARRRTRPDAWT